MPFDILKCQRMCMSILVCNIVVLLYKIFDYFLSKPNYDLYVLLLEMGTTWSCWWAGSLNRFCITSHLCDDNPRIPPPPSRLHYKLAFQSFIVILAFIDLLFITLYYLLLWCSQSAGRTYVAWLVLANQKAALDDVI